MELHVIELGQSLIGKQKREKKNNPFYPPVYSSSVMNFVIGTHVLALAFWVMLPVHI